MGQRDFADMGPGMNCAHDGLSRRGALATIAAALGGLGIPAYAAPAADTLTVRLDWITHVMHLPFHLATERGWFKAANLDVSIEDGNGSVTTVQLVGNGRFDVGMASLSAMAVGAGSGLPVISLAGYLQKSPLGVIYAKSIGLKGLNDLIGKKIVFTPGSFEAPFLEPFFAQNGIPVGKLNLVGVEASAKIASFVSGNADAVVTSVPSDLPHVVDKRPSDSLLFADYGMDLPSFGLFTRIDTLKNKGPAIKRFASVISASWAYIMQGHAEEGAQAAMRQRPGSATSVKALLDEFQRLASFFTVTNRAPVYPGMQDRGYWESAIKVMETAKVIPAGSPAEKFFTNDYIDADYGNKTVGLVK
jgi:NitT/TauT family transport system substrate-binding protein